MTEMVKRALMSTALGGAAGFTVSDVVNFLGNLMLNEDGKTCLKNLVLNNERELLAKFLEEEKNRGAFEPRESY